MRRCQVGDLWVLGAPPDRRPSGRPAGRALDRRAASTLDAIFWPSDLDRPRTERPAAARHWTGPERWPVRWKRPMLARESVYRRSTARVRVTAARHAAHCSAGVGLCLVALVLC